MKNLFLLFCFVLSTSGFSCKETSTQEKVKVVSAKEMYELFQQDSVQLIDVRTPQEYHEGHISKAKNIDFLSPSFTKEINTLNKEKPVLIYCYSGGRSRKSVNIFLKASFTKIYELEGGISEWKAQGFDIEN